MPFGSTEAFSFPAIMNARIANPLCHQSTRAEAMCTTLPRETEVMLTCPAI